MKRNSVRSALAILLAATAQSRGQSAPRPSTVEARDSTTVVLLGTGGPAPDPTAFGPATTVVVGSRVFVFDAGVGIVRRLMAAGLPPTGVTALFVSHLHSDHTLGYPDLIFTTWVMGRRAPLQVYGPPGLQRMTDDLLAAWKEDEDIRVNGLERENRAFLAVHVHEIRSGVVYDSGGVRVTAIPVLHGSWPVAFGYRVETPTRTIVLSGDTRYAPALERAAHGADILVHEVYAPIAAQPEDRPGGNEWPQYIREFHTSAEEVGRLAAAAQPKLLVLNHVLWGRGQSKDEQQLLAAVRRGGFKGRVVVGHDLDRF